MADFGPAFDFLMDHEDSQRSWAAATDNNGGEVIAGINSMSFPSDFALVNSIMQPNRGPFVAEFYEKNFWNPMRLAEVDSQPVATRLLDASVNMGIVTAVKVLQRAINDSGGNIAVDGHIGPITRAAANYVDSAALLTSFRSEREAYYRQIAENHPEDQKYLKGWLARASA